MKTPNISNEQFQMIRDLWNKIEPCFPSFVTLRERQQLRPEWIRRQCGIRQNMLLLELRAQNTSTVPGRV